MTYKQEDINEFVNAFYPNWQLSINVSRHGTHDGSGKIQIPQGSDRLFERMENFLDKLDKRGYKIVKK